MAGRQVSALSHRNVHHHLVAALVVAQVVVALDGGGDALGRDPEGSYPSSSGSRPRCSPHIRAAALRLDVLRPAWCLSGAEEGGGEGGWRGGGRGPAAAGGERMRVAQAGGGLRGGRRGPGAGGAVGRAPARTRSRGRGCSSRSRRPSTASGASTGRSRLLGHSIPELLSLLLPPSLGASPSRRCCCSCSGRRCTAPCPARAPARLVERRRLVEAARCVRAAGSGVAARCAGLAGPAPDGPHRGRTGVAVHHLPDDLALAFEPHERRDVHASESCEPAVLERRCLVARWPSEQSLALFRVSIRVVVVPVAAALVEAVVAPGGYCMYTSAAARAARRSANDNCFAGDMRAG